ncbi:hypothetical protein [Desulfofustis glycolicus]|uniref:Uncharacterized protein n=1 Tax=Desulfofustis glycolicus DSM 9705 TaxID=1121409 RepID=A0A1M5YDV3_9BACT|nr:hypothetical protein [Desulfofustis glycolicus]MCB2216921.1 hypothetical protein [Desulfobulbaceae bacterium]SHI10215.1 hypothetical protein SAMN02745124_03920 [Desulfofustis glycolicus DSM 9705]
MTSQQQEGYLADPTTINEFMNSLQRLFKIGIYYPSGHATLDKATERFLRLLKTVAGDQPEVTISEHGESLMVADLALAKDFPFVPEFKSLMAGLGIIAIGISREITSNEIHLFVRKMLRFRSQVLKARTFQQIEVTDLPLSINLTLKEFLARKDASISDDQSGESAESLEGFVESLSKYGLSGEEIQQCKTLLDKLPQRLSNSSVALSELPYASWDDVARLLARTIRANQQGPDDDKDRQSIHSNINALASILKKLEREATDKDSRETINLLISIIRKPFSGDAEAVTADISQVQRVFPETPYFSSEQIQLFTTKHRLHPKILQNIPEGPTSPETLSIILQLTRYEQSLANQARMQQLIREILAGPVQEKTWDILSGGLHELLKEGSPRIATALRLVAEPLRRSPHATTLYLLLLTARRCNGQETKRLWPYTVNEILVCGSSTDEQSFVALCRFAARFSPADMAAGLEHLRDLDAFQNNTIAPDIFPGLSTDCYPLFAFLLKTEIESYVGERVIGGLRRRPPEWLIKAVVHLLDLSKQEHKLFLYSYLRQAPEKSMPPVLKGAAAKIIADGLATLPQERRAESWLPETIGVLTQLPAEQTTAILEQIASERKLLFIPEWPSECRKAAQQALADHKRHR